VLGGDSPVDMRERLTPAQVLLEEIMLGMRTVPGLDLSRLRGSGDVLGDRLEATIADFVREGLILRNGDFLQLSPKGYSVCDSITESLSTAAISL
jgi:coproporphyrinogen III oxidase-like Fe-S oxidoreductase